jgi:hypothetical protein
MFGGDPILVILVLLISAAICGAFGEFIAVQRKLNAGTGFIFGFFLGPIGLIIVALLRRPSPPPPPGMRAIRCPRCNTDQNVSETAASCECWQCKQKIRLKPATA